MISYDKCCLKIHLTEDGRAISALKQSFVSVVSLAV